MPKTESKIPLLVIVGETGSGKSALAMQLAEHFGGEIICADSRTVYTGMDIGTAKPSAADRCQVPHYGLNLVAPGEQFTVADFKQVAQRAIDDITSRGRLPIMAGGTGLYIDAILYDYRFRGPADTKLRAELETFSVQQLQQRLAEQAIALPENAANPRHLIRALETGGKQADRSELRPGALILGLQPERVILRGRITARVDAMLAAGFIDDVRALLETYGQDCAALRAPGYNEARQYLEGTISMPVLKERMIQSHLDLAKRQRTWFKRNKSIHWLSTEDKYAEAVDLATTFLNK